MLITKPYCKIEWYKPCVNFERSTCEIDANAEFDSFETIGEANDVDLIVSMQGSNPL